MFWLLDVDSGYVPTTTALFDVLPLDSIVELVGECFVEEFRGMAVISVRDQIHVVACCGVPYCVEPLCDDESTVLAVVGFFEICRPRVVVDMIRNGFGVAV